MRVDGSISSVTAGVTTQSDFRQEEDFCQQQDNWRADRSAGLVRRPGFEWQTRLAASHWTGRYRLQLVTIAGIPWWVYVVPGLFGGPDRVRVYSEDGAEQIVGQTGISKTYLGSVEDRDDIVIAPRGDIVMIANKRAEVRSRPTILQAPKNSMLHAKIAPTQDTTLVCTFKDTAGLSHVAAIAVGTTLANRATNAVAINMAVAVNSVATAVGITAVALGSTVVFLRTGGGYCELSSEDGDGNLALLSMNEAVNEITHLPAFSTPNQIMKVQPDPLTDKGTFYMRAELSSVALPSDPSTSAMLLEGATIANYVNNTGFSYGYSATGGGSATITPSDINGITVWGVSTHYRTDKVPAYNRISMLLGLHSGSLIQSIRVVDRATGEIVAESNNFTRTTLYGTWVEYQSEEIIPASPSWGMRAGRDYEFHLDTLDLTTADIAKVIWVEEAKPSEVYELDQYTMPHMLTQRVEEGTRIFNYGPAEDGTTGVSLWTKRGAGDSKSNPMPVFVGKTLSYMTFYQDRLCILAGEHFVTSSSEDLFNFFRESMLRLEATDRISISSTAEDGIVLSYAIQHNKDLLLISSVGQFKVDGSIRLTPQTAALPRVANIEHEITCKPISNGKDVYFCNTFGASAGLIRWSVADSNEQDIAQQLANHVRGYMPGDPLQLATNFSVDTVLLRCSEETNVIYVFEYDWREVASGGGGRRPMATSWGKWILPDDAVIEDMVLREATLYLAYYVPTGESVFSDLFHMKLNLYNLNENNKLHVILDRRVVVPGVTQDVTLPSGYNVSDNTVVVVGSDVPGQEFHDVAVDSIVGGASFASAFAPDEYADNLVLKLTAPLLSTGSVFVGDTFTSAYMPAKVRVRDEDGNVMSNAKIQIKDWRIQIANGGDMTATIVSDYYDWPNQYWSNYTVNDVNSIIDEPPVGKGEFVVEYKSRPEDADLLISTDSFLPATIEQVEWTGKFYKPGERL